MKVLVTGALGFIGNNVVSTLVSNGHDVTATDIIDARLKEINWGDKVKFIPCDLSSEQEDFAEIFGVPDVLIHLAWAGLPNYKDLFHFEKNLPISYSFIKKMVDVGCPHILTTGTCFEYGKQEGELNEEGATNPTNPYGLAKDTLRKFLIELNKKSPFTLQWARLFYMYGKGQSPNSLLSQLDKAIDNGDKVFNMSGGEQLRDYLPVEKIANYMVKLISNPKISGAINICSGKPISVKELVEQRIKEKKSDIKLNLGFYPYPDYEPMNFWGKIGKLKQVIE